MGVRERRLLPVLAAVLLAVPALGSVKDRAAKELSPADEDLLMEQLPDFEQGDLGESAGETGNPVAPNPYPRDYYFLPNKRAGGGDLLCRGQFAVSVPTGNLRACEDICNECPLCQGWVYDNEPYGTLPNTMAGKCKWKNIVPSDACDPPECEKDSYSKCPAGRWSDGVGTDPLCYNPPKSGPGYSRSRGSCDCPTEATDMMCNASTTLIVPDHDMGKCADMCNECAEGATTCIGWTRTRTADGESECRFKSAVTGAAINAIEDLYQKCGDGEWSDGTMGKCGEAPKNYAPIFNMDGGTDLACNSGSPIFSFGTSKNLTLCAKICDSCQVGADKCMGFVRKEDDTCVFKTSSPPFEGPTVPFASAAHPLRDSYSKCDPWKWNNGSMPRCLHPGDWQVDVVSGGASTCTCQSRPVGDKRYSSAHWKFDVWDNTLPMFLSSKPVVAAPCPMANADECLGKSDGSLRTSGAGTLPEKVRITADADDGWCMKSFCIQSPILGKRFVNRTPKWMNPGSEADDGKCLPATPSSPNNNWGWCRYVAPGVQSNMTNCNTYNNFQRAFWEIELTQEEGLCSQMIGAPVTAPIMEEDESFEF